MAGINTIRKVDHDASGVTRWKAALNAFAITFDGRLSSIPR
jgi:hypothetical protein